MDAEVADVLAEARARGFTVNRSAQISSSCLYGELTVASPYMRRGVGDTSRPVRELGLTHRSKTPAPERALTDFGIEDSFGVASSRFEEHYGCWEIHRTSLLRVVHDATPSGSSRNASQRNPMPSSLSPACLSRWTVASSGPGPWALPTRRSGRLFEESLFGSALWTTGTFVSLSVETCTTTRTRRSSEACPCSPRWSISSTLRHATEVSYPALWSQPWWMGGNGLREAIEARFGDCIVVLDRPHMSQHLHDVAKHMELSDRERFAWVSRVLEDFFEGRVAKVYAELDAYCGPAEDRVRRFLEHLWRFLDAVDYGQAHYYGIPQGSGEIESARLHPAEEAEAPGCVLAS